LQRMRNEGHQVAAHTYVHRHLANSLIESYHTMANR
jgi:peptidoglycan/xylan/chitin deacetylase (PgdA/CDA1 family)